MAKWRASGTAQRASQWKNFWRPDPKPDADLHSDIMSSTKGVQSALLQVEDIMKQLDEAAEELFIQVRCQVRRQSIWVGVPGG